MSGLSCGSSCVACDWLQDSIRELSVEDYGNVIAGVGDARPGALYQFKDIGHSLDDFGNVDDVDFGFVLMQDHDEATHIINLVKLLGYECQLANSVPWMRYDFDSGAMDDAMDEYYIVVERLASVGLQGVDNLQIEHDCITGDIEFIKESK